MSLPPPGWYPDPAGAHEQRRWDGAGWTDEVHDAGRAATDPLAAHGPRAPGWYPDPEGRYEERRWDGRTWTREVRDGGAPRQRPLAVVAGVLAVAALLGGCTILVVLADTGPDARADCTELFAGEAESYVDEHPPPGGIDPEQLVDDLEGACLAAADEGAEFSFGQAYRDALAAQSGGGDAF